MSGSHQLSQEYQREITRLDQIPDEELEKLARWGFTGLWLIGLWERSRASARIKQLMGNPEAIASAYSLFDYRIAGDLGGEEAYQVPARKSLALRHPPGHRTWSPTTWASIRPGWSSTRTGSSRSITAPSHPIPSPARTCPAISRGSIHIEDHYFTRSDAAVVFKLYRPPGWARALHLSWQ